MREGIRGTGDGWGHDFVQAQFVGQLVNRRKRYPADVRLVLADNQALRDRADYRTDLVASIQAGRALGQSRTFVQAVRQGGGFER